MTDLASLLRSLDGRPYPAYRRISGRPYQIGELLVRFDHVQGDPFASPSRVRVDVPPEWARLPLEAFRSKDSRRATADFLQRAVRRALPSDRLRGSGKSGRIEMAPVGQEVLDRTGTGVSPDGAVTLRLVVGLPAAGRRILGGEAAEMLTRRLPAALTQSVAAAAIDHQRLRGHIATVEDQVALRASLAQEGLVGFLAGGSILPRRSGVDDRPMPGAIPLTVPPSLSCVLQAPHAGRVEGLAIRPGVTLIVGGGYHGKSTVLDTLARGVYDHIPGDGRECAVTLEGTLAVRAEDGRAVRGVDLRAFISQLPMGRSTASFDTDDASGSTSQAAAIIEALEMGAQTLLVDEDTAATNFMMRDARMRRLIPSAKEPITPFLERVRQLFGELGVSSVLVVGGAGDYLDVADTVIHMDEYRPVDVTAAAQAVARALPAEDGRASVGPWPPSSSRVPEPASLDAASGRGRERVRGVRTRAIEFGGEEIDVSLLAGLVDPAQCRMIGDALLALSHGIADGRLGIAAILDRLDVEIDRGGLEALTARGWGDRARARRFEIGAALNRLRSLRLRSSE